MSKPTCDLQRPPSPPWLLLGTFLVGACASSAPPAPRPSASPPATTPAAASRCTLLSLEVAEREGDRESDSIALVASYQPGASGAAPFGLKFRVRREREDDLRAHLSQHAELYCTPSGPAGADETNRYRLELPPFEGQQGEVQ
ncbi:MAG: hypothetical protein OEZ06_00380 [Myxococcales bacterium]|nr:hypothetical protein [Myxococcales bacterium]